MLTEREWQSAIVAYATARGWRHFHPHDSRRSPSGFPDLTLVRAGRLVFAELKREKDSRTSVAQREWLDDLAGCIGVEVFLWRPSDVAQVMKVLA